MARDGHGNTLMAEHPEDVVYVSVMLDANSSLDQAIVSWASEYSANYPVLADNSGELSSFVVSGYPTFVIIDKDMVIKNTDLWPYDESFIKGLF